jgi:hypothetical protein
MLRHASQATIGASWRLFAFSWLPARRRRLTAPRHRNIAGKTIDEPMFRAVDLGESSIQMVNTL